MDGPWGVNSTALTFYIVLHPQLKLKYFQQNGWLRGWIKTAEEIVRDEFEKYRNVEDDIEVVEV